MFRLFPVYAVPSMAADVDLAVSGEHDVSVSSMTHRLNKVAIGSRRPIYTSARPFTPPPPIHLSRSTTGTGALFAIPTAGVLFAFCSAPSLPFLQLGYRSADSCSVAHLAGKVMFGFMLTGPGREILCAAGVSLVLDSCGPPPQARQPCCHRRRLPRWMPFLVLTVQGDRPGKTRCVAIGLCHLAMEDQLRLASSPSGEDARPPFVGGVHPGRVARMLRLRSTRVAHAAPPLVPQGQTHVTPAAAHVGHLRLWWGHVLHLHFFTRMAGISCGAHTHMAISIAKCALQRKLDVPFQYQGKLVKLLMVSVSSMSKTTFYTRVLKDDDRYGCSDLGASDSVYLTSQVLSPRGVISASHMHQGERSTYSAPLAMFHHTGGLLLEQPHACFKRGLPDDTSAVSLSLAIFIVVLTLLIESVVFHTHSGCHVAGVFSLQCLYSFIE